MSDKTIELNRRRVLGGMITLGGAAAAAGAGTFAYFSDSTTSTDNNIVAGTLQLGDAANGQFTASDLAPGQRLPESATSTIEATYDSSSDFDPAELDFEATISQPSSEQNPTGNDDATISEFAGQLNLETAMLSVGGSQAVDFVNDEGYATLDDLAGHSIDAVSGGISPGDTVAFDIAVTMDPNAGNAYQGDGVALDVTFRVEQSGED